MDPITVVLADDHPVVRAGLRADLGDCFHIVAEAATADEAIAAIDQHTPQLVICDVHMPGGGARVAAHASATTRVVMFSVSEAETDVLDAVRAGAIGYLPKNTPTAELRDALTRAAQGEPVMPPDLAMLLTGEFRKLTRDTAGRNPLTDRERDVLTHLAKGRTYRQIGDTLFISERTVETHVRNILDKLQLSKRGELIAYAHQHDIR